jgi:hypothetical protein
MLDLTNQKFGMLTVQCPVGRRRYLCLCDCGQLAVVCSSNLRSGNTRSCGCLSRKLAAERETTHGHNKHGQTTRTYNTWNCMKIRCLNPKHTRYPDYGGRGITVCDRWIESFAAFLADMGERPEGMTIDRYPNKNGNYEPGNTRWATPKQQRANRRNVRTDAAIELPLAA